MKYIIKGGNKLKGEIRISGNKNSVFPCVAAALLTDEEVVLENIPQNRDTQSLLEILKSLDVEFAQNGNTLKIKASKIGTTLSKELMMKLRGAIVLVGAILARKGFVTFAHPGGDIIGKRSIQPHLDGFISLGADVKQHDLSYEIKLKDVKLDERSSPLDKKIFLTERSVTGTENLILASSLQTGKVTLRNCATEPNVVDLCNLLSKMGVSIKGIGSDTLEIEGQNKLNGGTFKISADFVEVGTYAIASAITGGEVTLKNTRESDLDPIVFSLERFGINFTRQDDELKVSVVSLKSVEKLVTNVWPGFPTDLMSAAIVLATQADGVSLCHDWMFESRMFFVDKLISMGAKIVIADPHRVLVSGPAKLKGRELESPDIRAGISLVLAALVADGESVIEKAELIERGYEDVVGKLQNLGADIKKVV